MDRAYIRPETNPGLPTAPAGTMLTYSSVPIRGLWGQLEMMLTLGPDCPLLPAASAAHGSGALVGARAIIGDTEVGTVRAASMDYAKPELTLTVQFDAGVTAASLAGNTIRLPLRELVERQVLTVTLSDATP